MALVPIACPITLATESLVDLASALHGALFLCLSADALTTWDAETLTVCHISVRSKESLETHGHNAKLFLQKDARLAVIRTTMGSLLTYALYQDIERGLLKLKDTAGVVKSWTKHKQTIRIAAEALAVCATSACLFFSTREPATAQILHWNSSKKGKAQTVSVQLRDLPFVQGPACTVDEIVNCTNISKQLWRTSSGHAYLVIAGEEGDCPFEGFRIGDKDAYITAMQVVGIMLFLGDDRGNLSSYDLASVVEGNASPSFRVFFPEAIQSIDNARGQLMVCAGATTYMTTLQGIVQSSLPQSGEQRVWLDSQLLLLQYATDKLKITRYARLIAGTSSARPMLQRPDKLVTFTSTTSIEEQFPLVVSPPDQAVQVIECASVSSGGRYVAVAGGGRLAHFSARSGTWKTQSHWDETFQSTWLGWYLHMLIVAGFAPSGSFEIRLFSRDMSLSQALHVHVLEEPAECISLQYDMLLFATKTELCCWRIAVQKASQICLEPLWRRDFKHETRISMLSVMGRSAGDHTAAHVLQGQTLKVVNFAANSESILSKNADWYRYHHEKGPLQGSLWAISAGSLFMWQSPNCDSKPLLTMQLDMLPISLSFASGTIMGLCKSATADGETFVDIGMRVQQRSYVPALFCALVEAADGAFSRTASELLYTLKESSGFSAVLELVLYTALEDHPTLLQSAWQVIAGFEDSTEAVSRLARKVEAKQWPVLFAAVGSPDGFFRTCLKKGDLEVAGNFLIVMSMAVGDKEGSDAENGYKASSLELLTRAAQADHWDLAAELLKFMTASLETFEECEALLQQVRVCTDLDTSST